MGTTSVVRSLSVVMLLKALQLNDQWIYQGCVLASVPLLVPSSFHSCCISAWWWLVTSARHWPTVDIVLLTFQFVVFFSPCSLFSSVTFLPPYKATLSYQVLYCNYVLCSLVHRFRLEDVKCQDVIVNTVVVCYLEPRESAVVKDSHSFWS